MFSNPAVSPDARLTVAAEPLGNGAAYDIVIREIGSGREVQRFQSELAEPELGIAMEFQATFSPDSKRVALQTFEDRKVWLRVYDIETASELYSRARVRHVTFSPDGNLLALRDEKDDIRVVNTTSWKDVLKTKADPPQNGFFGGEAIISHDGKRLAAVDGDTIKIWDLSSGKVVSKRAVDGSDLSNLVFAPGKDVLT